MSGGFYPHPGDQSVLLVTDRVQLGDATLACTNQQHNSGYMWGHHLWRWTSTGPALTSCRLCSNYTASPVVMKVIRRRPFSFQDEVMLKPSARWPPRLTAGSQAPLPFSAAENLKKLSMHNWTPLCTTGPTPKSSFWDAVKVNSSIHANEENIELKLTHNIHVLYPWKILTSSDTSGFEPRCLKKTVVQLCINKNDHFDLCTTGPTHMYFK